MPLMNLTEQTVLVGLAVVAVIACSVTVWSRGRSITRLERALTDHLGTSQPRGRRAENIGTKPSQGKSAAVDGRPNRRRVPAAAGLVIVVALAAVGVFALMAHLGRAGRVVVRTVGLGPDPQTVVPSNPPAAADPGSVSVAVLGIPGGQAAASRIQSELRRHGFTRLIASSESSSTGAVPIVMWSVGQRSTALEVAHDVGISRVAPLDGLTPAEVGNADAVVLVGPDS